MADQLDEFVAALRAYADNEYCIGIRMAHREDKCLGWEHKVKTGKFGAAEKAAHTKMDRHLGAHFGIHAAINQALAQVGPAGVRVVDPVREALVAIVAAYEAGQELRGSGLIDAARLALENAAGVGVLDHQVEAPSGTDGSRK
ncbi:MAG TPA: hypothetical protein VFM12_01440 [Gemmatimonadales bacterium]|nr:hypothetical protein [Gemmatimonadales bacterium]